MPLTGLLLNDRAEAVTIRTVPAGNAGEVQSQGMFDDIKLRGVEVDRENKSK